MMHTSAKHPHLIFASWLATGVLAVGAAGGQTLVGANGPHKEGLNRRVPKVTPSLDNLYNSQDYRAYFIEARRVYLESKPETSYSPVPFNPYDPARWLQPTQAALISFANQTKSFDQQLTALEKTLDPQKNGKEIAQVRQIQFDFSRKCLAAISRMMVEVPLSDVFFDNDMPAKAAMWFPPSPPFYDNKGAMSQVSDVILEIEDLLGDTITTNAGTKKIVFERKAGSNKDVLRDDSGKPLPNKVYKTVWLPGPRNQYGQKVTDEKGVYHPGSAEILNATVVELYDTLAQARKASVAENLFPAANDILRQTAGAPATKAGQTTVVSLATH